MHRVIAFLWVGMALMVAVAHGGDDKKGAAKLDGAWTATSWRRGDAEIGKDKVDTELVFNKDTYEFPNGINRISKKGSIKIDAAKGSIDFMPADGFAKGKTLLGIFKVDGDKLTLCFTSAGNERPKEFKTDDRSTVLATYIKKKK
jgi:uncharacterized protein (TIGR03067 family)